MWLGLAWAQGCRRGLTWAWQTPDVVLEDALVPAGISHKTTPPEGIPAAGGEAVYVSYPASTGSTVTVVISVR